MVRRDILTRVGLLLPDKIKLSPIQIKMNNNFNITPFKKIESSFKDIYSFKIIPSKIWYLSHTIKLILMKLSTQFLDNMIKSTQINKIKYPQQDNSLSGSLLSITIKTKTFANVFRNYHESPLFFSEKFVSENKFELIKK